jgi:hypothetical protein
MIIGYSVSKKTLLRCICLPTVVERKSVDQMQGISPASLPHAGTCFYIIISIHSNYNMVRKGIQYSVM